MITFNIASLLIAPQPIRVSIQLLVINHSKELLPKQRRRLKLDRQQSRLRVLSQNDSTITSSSSSYSTTLALFTRRISSGRAFLNESSVLIFSINVSAATLLFSSSLCCPVNSVSKPANTLSLNTTSSIQPFTTLTHTLPLSRPSTSVTISIISASALYILPTSTWALCSRSLLSSSRLSVSICSWSTYFVWFAYACRLSSELS